MKKIYILLTATFLLCLSYTTTMAQANKNDKPITNHSEHLFYKHEIGVSCGLFSAPILIPLPYLPSVIPNLNFDYHYNFNEKHSIGVSYSISTDFPYPLSRWINKNYIDEHPEFNKSCTPSIFNSLQLGYKISFLKKGKFTLYSSFFAGVNLGYYGIKDKEFSNFLILPSLHVTPLGFTYGEQNTLNFEFGIGSRGLFIIGYRYHFNK